MKGMITKYFEMPCAEVGIGSGISPKQDAISQQACCQEHFIFVFNMISFLCFPSFTVHIRQSDNI